MKLDLSKIVMGTAIVGDMTEEQCIVDALIEAGLIKEASHVQDTNQN